MGVDVEDEDVDPEVDEEGHAVHVAAGGGQVEGGVAVVVRLFRVATSAYEDAEGVEITLEGRPSEGKKTSVHLALQIATSYCEGYSLLSKKNTRNVLQFFNNSKKGNLFGKNIGSLQEIIARFSLAIP